MSAEFTLSLRPPRDDAGSPDFVEIGASVACRGFSGKTGFSLARRDLNAYVEDVKAVAESRALASLLIGGWEAAEERLRLRITPAGRSGQFHATVEIATTGPRTDQWQRVETDFICSPSELLAFVRSLDGLAHRGEPREAMLLGDEDGIA